MNKGAIIGTVLGDAYIHKNTHTASLIISQGLIQQEYAKFKADLIGLPYKTAIYNQKYPLFCCRTESTQEMYGLRMEFYPNGRKIVTRELLSQLNPMGIALWYFDDGCYTNGAIRLSTNCFNYQEHILMQDYFRSLNIRADIRKSKQKYYELYFNRKNALLFLQYILPWCNNLPDSMKYKLGPLWEGNEQRLEDMQNRKLNSSRKYNQSNKNKGKEYRKQNRDVILKRKRDYYTKNCEIIKQKAREYNQKNRELISSKNKKYYQSNKEHIIQMNALWAKNNKEKVESYKNKYRKLHPDRVSESQRKHRLKAMGA